MPNDTVGEQWLLMCHSLAAEPEDDFLVSNAPSDTPLTDLVVAASMRHEIEPSFEEAKDQLGLADYEVRTWPGWHRHRHMTLCFLAHIWLSVKKKPLPPWMSFSLAEWRCLLNILLPLPQLSQVFRLRWFWRRREQRLQAAASRLALDVQRLLTFALLP
jgi:hypothetical protein